MYKAIKGDPVEVPKTIQEAIAKAQAKRSRASNAVIIPTRVEWEQAYMTWRGGKQHWPKAARAKAVRGCRGKVCYTSRAEAIPEAKLLPAREGFWISIYFCLVCGGHYHIGNSRQRISTVNGAPKHPPKNSC